MSFIRHEIRKFHTVVGQYRPKNVHKQCAASAKFCFPNVVLKRMNIHEHWTLVTCFQISELMSCKHPSNYKNYWKKFLSNFTTLNLIILYTQMHWNVLQRLCASFYQREPQAKRNGPIRELVYCCSKTTSRRLKVPLEFWTFYDVISMVYKSVDHEKFWSIC